MPLLSDGEDFDCESLTETRMPTSSQGLFETAEAKRVAEQNSFRSGHGHEPTRDEAKLAHMAADNLWLVWKDLDLSNAKGQR